MQRNPLIPFTYNYSQPDEYHFSIDSIELAWEIAQYLKSRSHFEELKTWNTLDLCAGCGVVGFELNFHLPWLQKIDFLEVQSVYKPHFKRNLSQVQNFGRFQFHNANYESLLSEKFASHYDLIICNPPYFQVHQGKLSPSEFKNRCRFFIDSSFEKLLDVFNHTLSENGQAFLLLRSLVDHGLDVLTELKAQIAPCLQAEVLGQIRGTDLVRLTRAE